MPERSKHIKPSLNEPHVDGGQQSDTPGVLHATQPPGDVVVVVAGDVVVVVVVAGDVVAGDVVAGAPPVAANAYSFPSITA